MLAFLAGRRFSKPFWGLLEPFWGPLGRSWGPPAPSWRPLIGFKRGQIRPQDATQKRRDRDFLKQWQSGAPALGGTRGSKGVQGIRQPGTTPGTHRGNPSRDPSGTPPGRSREPPGTPWDPPRILPGPINDLSTFGSSLGWRAPNALPSTIRHSAVAEQRGSALDTEKLGNR